jgi:hypothetical protein
VVRQDKSSSGRVTPKGSAPGQPGANRVPVRIDRRFQAIVPVLMFGLLGAGLVIIMLNYLIEAAGAPSNLYLLTGLALILGGIAAATQYR